MTVKELIESLQNLDEEFMNTECLLAIDGSGGFADDCIAVYPVEGVFSRPIEGKFITAKGEEADYTPLYGYWHNKTEENKVLLYVFP